MPSVEKETMPEETGRKKDQGSCDKVMECTVVSLFIVCAVIIIVIDMMTTIHYSLTDKDITAKEPKDVIFVAKRKDGAILCNMT